MMCLTQQRINRSLCSTKEKDTMLLSFIYYIEIEQKNVCVEKKS